MKPPGNPETVRMAADAFASDVEQVTGVRPEILTSLPGPPHQQLILVGVIGHTPSFAMYLKIGVSGDSHCK